MAHSIGILIVVALYVAATTMVGSWSAKYTKDTSSFMSAKNLMGPVVVGILLMSEFIATGSTLGTAETAYTKGFSSSWNVISLGIAFILYGFFMAPKFQASGAYTISGALAKRYGDGTRMVVSIIMVYALIVVDVAAFTGGGVIFATILGISIQAGVWIIGIASILNVTLGGIRGVGFANLIHMFFKFVSLVTVSMFAWLFLRQHPEMLARIPPALYSPTGVGAKTLVSWTFANIGAIFATQYVIQCISSLTSEREARKASFIAASFIIPAGLFSAYIGVAARGIFQGIKPVMAFPMFLTLMPVWLAGIAIMGIVAVTFVTILACQVGITALIMSDFVIPLLKPQESAKLRSTRVVSILVGLVPIPFALFVPGLLKTIFFARGLRTTIAMVAVFMFYLPKVGSGKGATIGLIGSVIGTSVWFALGDPWFDNVYLAMLIPAVFLLGERLFRSEERPKAAQHRVGGL
jgi:SSS family solute:Na+ symporter